MTNLELSDKIVRSLEMLRGSLWNLQSALTQVATLGDPSEAATPEDIALGEEYAEVCASFSENLDRATHNLLASSEEPSDQQP